MIRSNESGFNYIANTIKTHEINLYLSEDTEGLDANEVDELRNFSCKQLETLLLNFQKMVLKFNRIQEEKKGDFAVYFKFNDGGILFHNDVEVAYEKITEDEGSRHPLINRVFITSIYVLRSLVGYYFSKMDVMSKIIEYYEQELQRRTNPLEVRFLQIKMNQQKEEINQQMTEIAQKLDMFNPIISSFLTNILNCMRRNNDCDIEYLTRYPDQIFGIVQSLCKLPKNDMITHMIHSSLVCLYLNSRIPRLIRYDIFNCILKTRELTPQLLREIEETHRPGILLDDALEFSRSDEHLYNFISCIMCIRIYMKKIKRKGTLSHFVGHIGNNVENMRSLIVGLFEHINKCVGHMYKSDTEKSAQIIDELSHQVQTFLKLIKQLIRLYPELINCHLVHYIPFVIINIWNTYREWVDDVITAQMSKILSECAVNADFINYFSSLISNDINQYFKLVFFDTSLVQKRLTLFNKLSNLDNEFIDPLQSTFILKVAFIPMSGTEPMLCDKYVIESYLRTKPENPFTREKMTISDFNRIQHDLNDLILAKEEQRKRFVHENK